MKDNVREDSRALVKYEAARRALADCRTVDEVKKIRDKSMAIRLYAIQAQDRTMKADAERIIWRAEQRMGVLLAETDFNKGGDPLKVAEGVPTLKDLGITYNLSSDSQLLAKIPEEEVEEALDSVDPDKEMRALMSKKRRTAKHKDIAEAAKAIDAPLGPFPLIYADPPWRFQVYSEKGLEKAPDKHYPTLSYDEIRDFNVGGKTIKEIAAKDAALIMWCTSSNVHHALGIMEAWGFTFKSSAVWVKMTDTGKVWSSTGLVFRNAHEVILYGTKGKMPGPQWQPCSVFMYPRGKHSAKPPEIRKAIEKMYPDFDAKTRLELFSRDDAKGWTHWGFEA